MLKTGSDAGTEYTFYTVPAGRVYFIDNIFKNFDVNVHAETNFRILDAQNNIIYRILTTGSASTQGYLQKTMRLIAGDKIAIFYHSADAAGQFGFSVMGIEEDNQL